jgi:hypothetical protein
VGRREPSRSRSRRRSSRCSRIRCSAIGWCIASSASSRSRSGTWRASETIPRSRLWPAAIATSSARRSFSTSSGTAGIWRAPFARSRRRASFASSRAGPRTASSRSWISALPRGARKSGSRSGSSNATSATSPRVFGFPNADTRRASNRCSPNSTSAGSSSTVTGCSTPARGRGRAPTRRSERPRVRSRSDATPSLRARSGARRRAIRAIPGIASTIEIRVSTCRSRRSGISFRPAERGRTWA